MMADPRGYDLVALKSRVQTYTVDRLKALIQGLNDSCGANLSRTGKKQELVMKILDQFKLWDSTSTTVSLSGARDVMDHIEENGSYDPAKVIKHMKQPPVVMHMQRPLAGASTDSTRQNGAGPSVPGSYPSGKTGLIFKPSPFFKLEQHISDIQMCPESANLQDRKSVFLEFTISADQRARLLSGSYQLRLYSTSSAFYITPTAFRPNPPQSPYPVEFPNTCEIRVNGTTIPANTRGLKKKPGTAPPANLGAAVRTAIGAANRLEMIYCNNQQQGQPLQPNKKYYIQVNLVSVTTVDQLVDRLKKGKYRSKEDVLTKMRETNKADEDIEVGPQKMSLKCPLSYIRINVPCRSSQCVHPQCFDAVSWYTMMEQTSTWMCPTCEKVLAVEDLIVDGYFDEILKATPESVEDVVVEADGAWHTSDHKHHSLDWIPPKPRLSSLSSKPEVKHPTPVYTGKEDTPPYLNGGGGTKPSNKNVEVFVLSDDDDDDPGPSSRQFMYGSVPPSSGQRQGTTSSDIIDLTLSEDEEPPLPLPTTLGMSNKRKDRSPTATSSSNFSTMTDRSKRSRLDNEPQSRQSEETLVNSVSGWSSVGSSAGGSSGFARGGYNPYQNGVRNPDHLPPLHLPHPQPHRDLALHAPRNDLRLPPLQSMQPHHPNAYYSIGRSSLYPPGSPTGPRHTQPPPGPPF